MKFHHIVIYSFVFVLMSIFSLNLVLYFLMGKQITQISSLGKINEKEPALVGEISKCSSKPKIERLEMANTEDPNLKKIAEYQNVCNSFVSDRVMFFTDMPKDKTIAKHSAEETAIKLREFSELGITPLVIIEPVTEWGLIDFEEFKSGFYDEWIDEYFKVLKDQEITDEMMGIWVPFPEANLPNWNHSNATPEDFSAIVNKYLGALREYFPATKTSILLNSSTYENDDFNWSSGEYVSLLQYVEGIEDGLVDSFGIQGFPWAPPATSVGVGIFDAREFLNSRLAIEAAESLGVKEIWFNTGTFSSKYTLDEEKTIYIEAEKRKAVLGGIFEEVLRTKDLGYDVWINIFAEDKSFSSEATNWSYWDGDASQTQGKIVFSEFISKLEKNEIPLSLFDIQN